MDKTFERCAVKASSLPAVPEITRRLADLSQSEDVDLERLTRLISGDPGLAVKLMQAANAPFFARSRRPTTLREAILTLGGDATISLALCFSLSSALEQQRLGAISYLRFWRRSIVTAGAARIIAAHAGYREVETALLAGLLQDIGIFALDHLEPRAYRTLAAQASDHEALYRMERCRFGYDHAEIGAWLLNRWGLPYYLAQTTAVSHATSLPEITAAAATVPAADGDTTVADATLINTTLLAGRLAELWVSEAKEPATLKAIALAHELFGWEQEHLHSIIAEISSSINDLLKLYELRRFTAEDLQAISEQAQEALICRNLSLVQRAVRERERVQQLEAEHAALREEVESDPLTELKNRRYLSDHLENLLSATQEEGEALTLALIDLDHFKGINDRYGHPTGDCVLTHTACKLRDETRKEDLLVRYGGEEFLLAFPRMDGEASLVVLERIRNAIAKQVFTCCPPDGELAVTVSIGFASSRELPEELPLSADLLLRAADHALYHAKTKGRNQVHRARAEEYQRAAKSHGAS
ncbi:hypothetical protein CKO15_03165 [Halorhodospira abdelmalekii]|uniref:GGDEF domain-containing protein n=1 Tax=Halorhodospira abdelmalekii TaxID=421629 RepID=UPI001906D6CE|nr:GGDEF domain-containing protein [Halorhodospira abdelmalekii]MBK1734298.1 hypothetical protein [Halorhodospira abdelmalekii]